MRDPAIVAPQRYAIGASADLRAESGYFVAIVVPDPEMEGPRDLAAVFGARRRHAGDTRRHQPAVIRIAPQHLAGKKRTAARPPPYPTAGSVMMMGTGRNAVFCLSQLLMSK